MQSNLRAIDVHALHQQVRGIMAGIHKLAGDIKSDSSGLSEEFISKAIDELRYDLERLKSGMEILQVERAKRASNLTSMDGLPSILGGMALGVILAKLWGSKLQLDLLPFLVGLDLVLGDSVNSSHH